MLAIFAYLSAHLSAHLSEHPMYARLHALPGSLREALSGSMKRRQGFTLIELLIFIVILVLVMVFLVLVIIAIMAGLKYLEVI